MGVSIVTTIVNIRAYVERNNSYTKENAVSYNSVRSKTYHETHNSEVVYKIYPHTHHPNSQIVLLLLNRLNNHWLYFTKLDSAQATLHFFIR